VSDAPSTAQGQGGIRARTLAFPWVTSLLSCAAILAYLQPELALWLEDQEGACRKAELWRPLFGHLAHASFQHLALNLGAFLILGTWRERNVGHARFLLEYAALAIGVAAGVRGLHVDWLSYRGLSGVVYGLLAIGLLPPVGSSWRSASSLIGLSAAALFAAKSLLEWLHGGWIFEARSLEEGLGLRYLAGSHVAGLAVGVAIRIGSGAHWARLKSGRNTRVARQETRLEAPVPNPEHPEHPEHTVRDTLPA